MTPAIEVCIPVWNEEKTIAQTLNALKNQTYKKFNIVIYDNHSTDDTCKIINQYKNDLKLRVIKRSFNVGQNENINRMFVNLEADYVAAISANDIVSENYLEGLLFELQNDIELGVAYSHATYVDESGQAHKNQPASWEFFSALEDDAIERACKVVSKYCQASQFFAMYRRKVLDRMQAQPFCYGGDHIFACEAAIYGRVKYVSGVSIGRSKPPGAESPAARGEHLANLFSKDRQRGLPDQSRLGKFEKSTPIVDMFHGHVDMFRHADIAHEERNRLIVQGSKAFLDRFLRGVTADAQRLVPIASNITQAVNPKKITDRMMANHVLRRIDQCLFLVRNEDLIQIRAELSKVFC